MTTEHISDALQFLDDDLLLQTDSLRYRTKGGFPMKKRLTILIAAVLIMALCCVTAFAAVSGGWFSDVTNGFGAVTGTEYNNATEEISVTADADGNTLTATVTFLAPDQFPYRELETLCIGDYRIDTIKGSKTDAAPIENGTALLTIPTEGLSAGSHTLYITSFIGEKKADAPLPIYGEWECQFEIK